jgi:hypothetical protein
MIKCGQYHRTRNQLWLAAAAVLFLAGSAPSRAVAQNNLNNHGGTTLQNPITAFLIYWLPDGVVLDTSVTDGTGNFESLTQRFFGDISGSAYFNIVTQYPGSCGSNQCVVQNGTGVVTLGGSWVDTQAYPNQKGTAANALQDSDIQNEVTRAIGQNNWNVNANTEFFVITGVFKNSGTGVVECNGSNGCTAPGGFCAYHSNFGFNGGTALYAYLSDANFNTGGCDENLSSAPNGQIDSDREVALMSHEFFETITDPLGKAWWDSSSGNEIGDNCNLKSSIVAMNGNNYAVQQQWSNDSSSCVTSFGPSVQLAIGTGSDDLRGDSSATATLESPTSATFETFTIKTQSDPSWSENTGHIAVSGFNQASQTALGEVAITLTSHNSIFESGDNWNIQSLSVTVLAPSGTVLCNQSISGNPLARLTESVPTAVFDTPNCQPVAATAEGVVCSVFDDGYANLVGPSDAVFTNGSQQACIPSGTATGTCRKWFGRCSTTQTGVPVDFNVFDDGYANLVGSSDAVFINGIGQACIPSGTATGTCRKWFGRAKANDGRSGTCIVFGDGYINQSNRSDAVFINRSNHACIPSGTAQGTCQKWWGRCNVQ